MTANELADKLKLVKCLAGDGQVLNDAEAMLRQQQVRIEQLLETQDYLYKRHDEQQAKIDELEAYQKHDIELAEAVGWEKGYEAGRQLGMKQERALWELAASTQEIMK